MSHLTAASAYEAGQSAGHAVQFILVVGVLILLAVFLWKRL